MAFVPAVILGAGAGAVAVKIRKGRPQMTERAQASMTARRQLNDYWRNRVPESFTDESTNRSDYQNFYYDYPRKFVDPVTRKPYWQVGEPGRNNATIQNQPALRQRPIWATDEPMPPKKRPRGAKAAQRRGTVPTY